MGAAYARLRLAEAVLSEGGDREAAVVAVIEGHDAAVRIRANRLRESFEALSSSAQIRLSTYGPETTKAMLPPSILTPRERGVMQLVAQGHTNREIGTRLFISEKTVSVHVSNSMAKLGALSRYEAAASAVQRGLL